MAPSATRTLEFDSAHRVKGHEGKCASLHGHRYKVEVEACAHRLDMVGRVIDFSILKSRLGGWLDDNWDHTSIIWNQDVLTWQALMSIPGSKVKAVSVVDFNPTAENMAEFLLKLCNEDLFKYTGIKVVRIRVWETPNCYAEAKEQENEVE